MSKETEEKLVCTFIKKRRNIQLRKGDNNEEDETLKKKSKNEITKNQSDDSDEESSYNEPKPNDDSNSDTDLTENLNELKKKFNKKSSHLTQSTKSFKKDTQPSETTLNKEIFTTYAANKTSKSTGPADMG